MEINHVKESTKRWVEQFVVAYELCPFAAHPFQYDKLRFVVVNELELEKQLFAFFNEIIYLEQNTADEVSNTLVIFPSDFHQFADYLDFYELAEKLLEAEKKDENFQLASFHPNYIFEGTTEVEASNYTNRSPYPMVHILRTNEVEAAIASHPDIESVPLRNIELMNKLGVDRLKKKLAEIKGAK